MDNTPTNLGITPVDEFEVKSKTAPQSDIFTEELIRKFNLILTDFLKGKITKEEALNQWREFIQLKK